MAIPDYRNRSPEQIISDKVYFDSVGYVYRALSWLDIAGKSGSVCAIQYAAHDTRQGIEQLLFEELVLSVGTRLDREEYEKCKGNSTKLHKIIRRLSPDYARLAEFTKTVLSTDLQVLPLETWNHGQLMKHWATVSTCLHWAGEPRETVESKEWRDRATSTVETAAQYIWEKKTRGYTGVMMPYSMQPEIRELWGRFRTGQVDIVGVERTARIALSVLRTRNARRGLTTRLPRTVRVVSR